MQEYFVNMKSHRFSCHLASSGASAISEGGLFIYSCSAQLISFEIESTSREINCAEHEYMNMSLSLIALAPLLHLALGNFSCFMHAVVKFISKFSEP